MKNLVMKKFSEPAEGEKDIVITVWRALCCLSDFTTERLRSVVKQRKGGHVAGAVHYCPTLNRGLRE